MSDRAVIYARVSSDEQARGSSLETQEASCRRFCAERGYDMLAAFADAHTGTELDRPGLHDLIEAVRTVKPDVVVLHDVDRLGRDEYVQAVAQHELTRHGARIEYVLGGSDELTVGLRKLIARYENRQRGERTRRGMVGRVSKGFPMVASRPPYGWMYVPGDRCGQLLHDPDEAPVVQRIFAWIAHDGLTLFEVARRLTVEGVPTRADRDGSIIHKAAGYGHWDHRALASMVRAEVHKGLWHWGKTKQVKHGDGPARRVPRPREEWVAVQVEPLVDVATWERAQERIVANRTNAKRNAKRDYLLRSLIFCPCGRRWVGHSRSPVDPHPSYRCASWQSPNAACAHRFMIRQATLERAVLDALKAFLSDPDVRGASLLAERDRVATARDTANEELATVDRELGKVERQLSRLLDQSLDGLFPTEQIATKSRALTAERARLLAKRERELAALAAPVLDIDGAIAELAPMVEAAFTTATPADLRHLLELLRIEVHIIDRETVRLTGLVGDIETHLSRVTNSPSKA